MEEPVPLAEEAEQKEPVKSEPTASASPSGRVGVSSPAPECSICLGHLVNTSFTDSCLHQFCFTCLLQWSKIKTECPLCKQTFKSIIHNVRSEEDYDQYHVPREIAQPPPVSPLVDINLELINLEYDFIRHVQDPVGRRFSFRTTMTPNRRFRLLPNPTHAQTQQIPEGLPTVSREELRYRRRNPSDYRRNVYRHGEWSAPLPGHYAGALERSAEFFMSNPYVLNRLIPWINRDLQILLNGNDPHIAYVLRTIMDALPRYDLRSAELRDLLRPHFGIHTDHFLHELTNFARTGCEMAAYDSYIRYPTSGLPSGYLNTVQTAAQSSSSSSSSSSVSDDSYIRVIEHVDIGEVEIPAVGPHPIDMPGPSTVSQALQLRIPTVSPTILTISSNSDESDCEVVGYVKPRHERTPEIIEIPSSDGEMVGPSISTAVDYVPDSPPALSPTFLDQPSTSQDSNRRHPRGAHRKSPMHFDLRDTTFSNSSSEDDSVDLTKKSSKAKRPRKTSKSCKKSPKKQSQKKDTKSTRKRSRKTVHSDDEDAYLDFQKKKCKRSQNVRSRAASHSSSDDENDVSQSSKDTLIIQIRKNSRQNQKNKRTDNSSSSSSESYSDSSSSDESNLDINLPLKKRKFGRDRRRRDNSTDVGKVQSTIVKCISVDSTILRKDATKKEWYVDKKAGRSDSSNSSANDGRHGSRVHIRDCRGRKMSELFSVIESSVEDDRRSSSQCNSRSDRTQEKYRRKHKSKRKEKERCNGSEEPSNSHDKHSSDGTTPKSRRKMHKKHKSSKGKRPKGKNKRSKRHYESWDSASSSSD